MDEQRDGKVKRAGSFLKPFKGLSKSRDKSKNSSSKGSSASTSSIAEGAENGVQLHRAALESLTDAEINERFERMLDDMNLQTEEKRAPLRKKGIADKRAMLEMQQRGSSMQKGGTSSDSQGDILRELTSTALRPERRLELLTQLRVSLTSNTIKWVIDFGIDGLNAILKNLTHYCDSKQETKGTLECVRCLKAFTNNKTCLKLLLQHDKAITLLSKTIDVADQPTMLETVRLLAAMALVPPDGHERVLEGITCSVEALDRERFAAIIGGMEIKDNINLRVACLQLTNAIISTPDDIDYRMHLRNEFMRAGLFDLMEMLERDDNEQVKIQIDVLVQHKEDDSEDFSHRFDNIRGELEEPVDCFNLLLNVVSSTPAEPYFLSILQHLLYIRDDPFLRTQYYKLIEECVTQIVLQKNGIDPDFRYREQRFRIDVEPLIGQIMEKDGVDRKVSDDLHRKLEEALTAKQESEARVASFENKLKAVESELTDIKAKRTQEIADKLSGLPSDAMAGRGGSIPPPPPLPGMPLIPPPPPLPGMGGGPPPPPPPPLPPGMHGGPPPPPLPGMHGGPPPPPPLPGMGPPPPPPLPGMGPPPPPPMPGMGPPPPPPMPGMGPPPPMGMPPPPGMGAFKGFSAGPVMPTFVKPKKKYSVQQPLKRANWDQIDVKNLTEDAFWVKVREEELEDSEIFEALQENFSAKPPAKAAAADDADKPGGGGGSSGGGAVKRGRQLKVLDAKAGQSLSILLGSVKVPYEELRRRVLRVDEENLSPTLIEMLVKTLPDAETMRSISELKDAYEDLAEPEQFCVTMSSIKRLHQRLGSILFKMRFQELVDDIKPDIVAATAACEEVKQSGKFKKILELVLMLGNYMNAGSKKEQSFGFEMNYLTKLDSTKSADNRQTLLHFLASTVQSKFPNALDFGDELIHIDQAAKVSDDQLQKNLVQMGKSLKELEIDIKNVQQQQQQQQKGDDAGGAEDRFAVVMEDFLNMAKQTHEVLLSMLSKMQSLFKELAKYYTFDPKKYSFEEFFTDLKTFKERFQQAAKDNVKLRETEEKIRRAKEAKEKAEREKREKIDRKKLLVDLTKDDDEEGVMDNLLDALQKGTAFNMRSDGGRKRTPRTTGAERRAQLQKSRSRSNMATGDVALRELGTEDAVSAAETPKRPERRKKRGESGALESFDLEAEQGL